METEDKKKVVLNAMHEKDLDKLLSDGLPEMKNCIKCGDQIKSKSDIMGLQIRNGKPHPICKKHNSYVWNNAMRLK